MSLADELRKLEETWKGEAKRVHAIADKERSKAGRDALMAQSVRYWMCADELSVLLDQHAVAEPQRVLTEHQSKVEEAAGMPIDWGMANASTFAHAAEQPKLTEADLYALVGHIRAISFDKQAVELLRNALLTSPVAPPPRNDKREGAERTARLLCETRGHIGRRPCDFCQMQIDACLRETEPLRTCYCGTPKEPHCESVHAPPPVAPPTPRFAQMIGGTWAGHNKGVHNENSFCRLAGCHSAAPPVAPGEQPPRGRKALEED